MLHPLCSSSCHLDGRQVAMAGATTCLSILADMKKYCCWRGAGQGGHAAHQEDRFLEKLDGAGEGGLYCLPGGASALCSQVHHQPCSAASSSQGLSPPAGSAKACSSGGVSAFGKQAPPPGRRSARGSRAGAFPDRGCRLVLFSIIFDKLGLSIFTGVASLCNFNSSHGSLWRSLIYNRSLQGGRQGFHTWSTTICE